MKRRLYVHTALIMAMMSGPVLAQEKGGQWPDRPLRMLVGSAPGGGTDAMARAIADQLGPLLNQSIVVENRPGVSNTLAADVTAKSTDGHTMVMGVSTAHAIAPHLFKLNYNSNKDLVPVAFVGAVPNVLVVTNDLPAKSVSGLVDLAKKDPGAINYASSGAGSTQHIAAEIFKDAAGIRIEHIPYKGSAPALLDVISGRVQMSFDTMPSVIGHINSGKLRPLAVTTRERNKKLPDVPTMGESGLPQVSVSAWYGIYMPAATPPEVQQKVHRLVNQILEMPATKSRLEGIGLEAKPISQDEFKAFHDAEFQRYGDIIRKNSISVN